jgi:hypothetical protein
MIESAYSQALQDEARGPSGGLHRIVELLREGESNRLVVENLSIAVAVLAKGDRVAADAFGNSGAIEVLLHCISGKFDGSSAVTSRVMTALCCLVAESKRNANLLESFNGMDRIGRTLSSTRFREDPLIAMDALRTLSYLLTDDKKRPKSGAAQDVLRTIGAVSAAMEMHGHRCDVQEAGLRALRNLLGMLQAPGAIEASVLNSIVECAATAFQLHGSDVVDADENTVPWDALGLLCDVDDARDSASSVRLDLETFFGSLRRIIADSDQDRSSEAAVARALHATAHIGWRSGETGPDMAAAGAVDAALEAMRAFRGSRAVLEPACSLARGLLEAGPTRGLVEDRMHELADALLLSIMAVTRGPGGGGGGGFASSGAASAGMFPPLVNPVP